MPEPHMMFIIDRAIGSKEIRVRSATERVVYFQREMPVDTEANVRAAVKDCCSWIIENNPINSVYIVNTSV